MGLPPRAQGAAGKRKRSNCDQDDEEDVKPIINLDSDDDSDASDSDDSDSDEDAQDGEGTGVIEHHEDSEDLPKCVAYDKDFAQVGHDLIGIPAKALQILRESGCDNKRVQGCQGNADELAKLPQAKREKVALLGNTGAGEWDYPEFGLSLLTSSRQELVAQLSARPPGHGQSGKFSPLPRGEMVLTRADGRRAELHLRRHGV